MAGPDSPTLDEAVTRFLTEPSSGQSSELQQELQKFVRWSGRGRAVADLTPRQIESYCESSGAASADRLAPIKAFLQHAHKQGLIRDKLASHVKVKRGPRSRATAKRRAAPARSVLAAQLTGEGYRRIEVELEEQKRRRVDIVEEIRMAAADKDFRENAPLDAAREKQGHLEARIRELEQTLRSAQVVGNGPTSGGLARLGSRILVRDMDHDEEFSYILVSRTEVDPSQGRISVESPVGKAFLNKAVGAIVKVNAPAGTLRFRIERVHA